MPPETGFVRDTRQSPRLTGLRGSAAMVRPLVLDALLLARMP